MDGMEKQHPSVKDGKLIKIVVLCSVSTSVQNIIVTKIVKGVKIMMFE